LFSNNRSTLRFRDSLHLADEGAKKVKKKRRPKRTKQNHFDNVWNFTPEKSVESPTKENAAEDSLMSSKYWNVASSTDSDVPEKKVAKSVSPKNTQKNEILLSSSDDEGEPVSEPQYIPRGRDKVRAPKPFQSIANRLAQRATSPSHIMSTPLAQSRGDKFTGLPKMVTAYLFLRKPPKAFS